MPQIWISYEEAGELMGCRPEQARDRIAALGWVRRRCSDGLSRAKLPDREAGMFLERHAANGRAALPVAAMTWAQMQARVQGLAGDIGARAQAGHTVPPAGQRAERIVDPLPRRVA